MDNDRMGVVERGEVALEIRRVFLLYEREDLVVVVAFADEDGIIPVESGCCFDRFTSCIISDARNTAAIRFEYGQ